ncbi:hypothetical protein CgunFtcFv8_024381 [Champsocephalus gunnari]|uniref:Uncharacterized protein n=1 Tax=Champsocephalus gunnari TaxID=52237 RepID=A0AAN8DEA9_CHAGU|nr:hypothetical protein CgunFtcFv8_024381 [Champsocephalus gunnari]
MQESSRNGPFPFPNSHHNPEMMTGATLSLWMSAREVRPVPVCQSWLPGRSCCQIPTVSRHPGSEATLQHLFDPGELKGKQQDLTPFQ